MTEQENKPDFLQVAIDRGLSLAAPDAEAMCEHVWSTYVVPLQEEKIILGERVFKFSNLLDDKSQEAQGWFDKFKALELENKSLRDEVERLKGNIQGA